MRLSALVRAGFLLAAFAAIVTGCALRPAQTAGELRNDALPNTTVPATWKAGGSAAAPMIDHWLVSFDDPALTALVEEALLYNADLQVAAARVEQAAGYVKAAGGSLRPSMGMLGKSGGKSGGSGGLDGVWLNASLELDIWGRLRYARAATQEQSAAATADYAFARQSLAANVAKSWFIAIQAGLQTIITQDALRSAEELLRVAGERLRVGSGNERAVAEARVNVGNYRDRVRQNEMARDKALRALELLLGRYPSAELAVAEHLPSAPPPVPIGMPSQLLERRPDVVAAERRVAASFDRVGEARAARLPSISLTAGGSSVSSELLLLNDVNNPIWSFGANLIAPLYKGGALRAQVEIRSAEQKQAVAEYARTGLRAFGEVEDALAADGALRDRETLLLATLRDSQRALELVRIQYRVGSVDLRVVEQSQLAFFSARIALLGVQSEQLAQRVNLYLALGGGFDPSAREPVEAQ